MNLGVAFGAGLYETRIVLPQWFSKTAAGYRVNDEAMRAIDTGRRFWGMVTTLPLTLLTFANLAVAWSSPPPRHDWWLAAALLTLLERLGTFGFFIPTAIKLQRNVALSEAQAGQLAAWWVRLNYGRNLLTLLAWLAALRAFSLPA
ncbi:anthrone oxygenase family protein [Hymenobacter rubidus]|uniref:anthrone oxygenase family protein n=1 Tax=Hymenobacter rubidus TaxID=1441626 RepID=UPI001F3DD2DD|nr:anthrone oxygenase family protein [Hymenobacter rubidus]